MRAARRSCRAALAWRAAPAIYLVLCWYPQSTKLEEPPHASCASSRPCSLCRCRSARLLIRLRGPGVWTPVPLYGGQIFALAGHPSNRSTVYAGTIGGMFKSTDGGGTWTLATNNFSQVYSIAIDPVTPSTLYAGYFGGMYKSIDSGVSFNYAGTGITGYVFPYDIAVDPATPSTLYAATTSGVFKSIDGAANWTAANSGLPTNVQATSIAIDPTNTADLLRGTFMREAGVRCVQVGERRRNMDVDPTSERFGECNCNRSSCNLERLCLDRCGGVQEHDRRWKLGTDGGRASADLRAEVHPWSRTGRWRPGCLEHDQRWDDMEPDRFGLRAPEHVVARARSGDRQRPVRRNVCRRRAYDRWRRKLVVHQHRDQRHGDDQHKLQGPGKVTSPPTTS